MKHNLIELSRLRRIAGRDGLRVVTTARAARARSWGGYVAVMDQAGSILLTTDSLADVRAWLHTRANERACSGMAA